jgi:hypothetical protein
MYVSKNLAIGRDYTGCSGMWGFVIPDVLIMQVSLDY